MIRRAALGAAVIGAFLLPAAAPASDRSIATTDLATVADSAAIGGMTPSVMPVSATPVSDAELATEEAKGLPEPEASVAQPAPPPRVILWDEIDRPGGWSPTGNGATVVTITGGP
ncbi:MAG TPA: hypothetical protein VMF62_19745 [Acetobacteraceae bacterium]|nr:hypothetical protein [Acetobacteraceae bacterium]